jgi:hypothetical protein
MAGEVFAQSGNVEFAAMLTLQLAQTFGPLEKVIG